MNKYFKVFVFFFFVFLGFLFLNFPSPVKAQGWCELDGWCNLLCGNDPDCWNIGTQCIRENCPSLSRTSYCCDPGTSCSPNLGENCNTIPPWTYCYDPVCKVKIAGEKCAWYWSFSSCGVPDTCDAAEPYLKAGRCGAGVYQCKPGTQCWVGGTYKTCCAVDANGNLTGALGGNCTGGCHSGICPGGSTAVQCGFGGKPACGTAACAVAGVTPTPGDDDGDDDEEGCPYPNDAGSYTKPNCQNWWDCPSGYDCGPDGCCRIFTPGDEEEDEHSAAWLEAKVLRVSGVTDTYEVPEDDCGGGIPPVNVSPGDQLGFTVKGWIRDMNSSGEPAGPTSQKPDAKVRGFFYFGGPGLAWDEEDTYGLLYHAPWVGRSEEFFRGDANAPIEILWHGSYSGVWMHDPGEDSSPFRARLRRLYSECEWQADQGRYPDCVNRDFGECQECDEGFGAPPAAFCSGSGTGSKCETGETSENKGNQLTFCSLKYADGNDSYDSEDYFEIGWGDNAFLEIRGEGAGQTFCVEGKFAPEQAEAEDTGKICFLIGPSGLTPSPTPTPRPSPTPTPFRGPVCTF